MQRPCKLHCSTLEPVRLENYSHHFSHPEDDIGDRINIEQQNAPGNHDGSVSWIVKDVSLFTTTVSSSRVVSLLPEKHKPDDFSLPLPSVGDVYDGKYAGSSRKMRSRPMCLNQSSVSFVAVLRTNVPR